MDFNFSSLELIKFALSIEEQGVKFYTENAKNATGKSKELLLKLANDEVQHAHIFKKMYTEFEESTTTFAYLFDLDVEAIFNSYANNEIFQRRTEVFDNIEDVIKLGAETEQLTIDYYTSLLPHSKEPLKSILERLIAEETTHYNQLMEL
jgi:rubrerythrin